MLSRQIQSKPFRADTVGSSDREQGLLPDGLDAYWRLDSYQRVTNHILISELRRAGYAVRSAQMNKATLSLLLQQTDKRLLCYDACSSQELEGFVKARGLQVKPSKRIEHTRLIETLEQGDAELSFDKLMDLPAELRVRIYEFYVCEFPESLFKPTQPPLARVSKQIRQELLPIFYNNHIFILEMHMRGVFWHTRMRWSADTEDFISRIRPIHLAMMRKIDIRIAKDPEQFAATLRHRDLYYFSIQLGDSRHSCSVVLSQWARIPVIHQRSRRYVRWQKNLESIPGDLQAIFEAARHRTPEKNPRLKLADLAAARMKVESRLLANRDDDSTA